MTITLRGDWKLEDVVGQTAFVYWDLHRGQWSIKIKGIVRAKADDVLLADAVGKVSEAGRQRVLRERSKNVHAGIVGTVRSPQFGVAEGVAYAGDRVTYNPYKYESFVHTVDGSKFEGSAYALLTADRSVFVA
jgi:hypothetical protein